VLHSGNHEVIGIRHRGSQTLYVSDVVMPDRCVDPGYGKIHVGIIIAAVRDAMDRMEQDEKRGNDGSQGGGGSGVGGPEAGSSSGGYEGGGGTGGSGTGGGGAGGGGAGGGGAGGGGAGGGGAGGGGAGGFGAGSSGAGGLEHSRDGGIEGKAAERLAIEVCIFALTISTFQ